MKRAAQQAEEETGADGQSAPKRKAKKPKLDDKSKKEGDKAAEVGIASQAGLRPHAPFLRVAVLLGVVGSFDICMGLLK